jgi:chromosome segregation ATPase
MFSGLGSIADLNQQFAQFTSNLTNLDSLQEGETSKKEVTAPNIVPSNASEEMTRQLEDQLAEYKVLYDSAMENLKTSNEEAASQKSRALELQLEVEEVRGYLSATTTNFDAYREQSEIRIQALLTAQHATQPDAGGGGAEAESRGVDNSEEVFRLQGEISKCEARNAELTKEIADNKRKAKAEGKESQRLIAERDASIQRLEQQVQEFQQSVVGLEDEKAALQTRAAQLEADLQSAAGVEAERDALLAKVAHLEDEAQKAAVVRAENTALAARVAALEENLRSAASLRDEKDALLAKTSRLEATNSELEGKLSQVRESAAQSGETASATQQQTERLQRDLQEAQRGAADAEGKVATLTEKLKDMMHRFAELKTKSAAQLQQAEDKYADHTKLAQAKVRYLSLVYRLVLVEHQRFTDELAFLPLDRTRSCWPSG